MILKRRMLSRKTRISIRRTMWILNEPMTAKDQRGIDAEEKVIQSLKYHQRKKTEFPGGRRIIEVNPTIHYSDDDKTGKDIIVKFQSESQPEEILPIQVQNWWSRESEETMKTKDICLIAVWPEEDEKEARKRTFKAISKFLREKK